jgi:cell wall-associated NlpC family hydrolase
METGFDPRVHAYRDDLADKELEGLITAERYTEGSVSQVKVGVTDIRSTPDASAGRASQAVRGETVRVFDEVNGWAWGQLEADGYVGYFQASALNSVPTVPTHEVAVLSTFIYPEPNIKSADVEPLSFGTKLAVTGEEGDFLQLSEGSYVYATHLRPINRRGGNVLAEIEKFVGIPYLWGGRSAFGLDCSALVQLSCLAAGIPAPRDSDMQEAYLGAPLDHMDPSQLQAGDLIYWKGHTGMMLDASSLIHVNGYHMQTVIEPLDEAISRIAYLYAKPTSFRRLL